MGADKARPVRILIAGGGTGGHLFPGLSIADAFLSRHPGAEIRFAGSSYGIEHRVVPARGFRLYRIPVRGLYGVSWRRRAWVLAMMPLALLMSAGILLTFRPHLVIGVGGYASGPVLAMAVLLRRVTVLQEQNAYPGLTNRLLGRYVRMAFVPVEGLERFFARSEVVGNPVRADILRLREEPPAARPEPMVLVFGGSQGARRINEAMVGALPLLGKVSSPVSILHQTGSADLGWASAGYAANSVPHQVVPFIEDMADAFRRCRLVVGRAGASTVNEIVTARRASILIPIPGASGEHQLKNARRVEVAGAGVVLEQAELSGETLGKQLVELLRDPARMDRMEGNCDALFPGDAAARIVEKCLQLIGRG